MKIYFISGKENYEASDKSGLPKKRQEGWKMLQNPKFFPTRKNTSLLVLKKGQERKSLLFWRLYQKIVRSIVSQT